MIDALLKDNTQVAKVGSPTTTEKKKVQEDVTESVKATLLISRADKTRFSKLKDELANNYLLGTNQYPDTFKKAMRILENHQPTKASRPYQGDGTESGLAFIQRGGRGRGRGGWRGGAGRGAPTSKGADTGAVDASSTTTGSSDQVSGGGARQVN